MSESTPTHKNETSEPTPPETWNDILKYKVEKDDPLWKEYVEKAAVFDERMVDEWNKIVDVTLVYVALFISVLTSFVIQTSTQFQRNPADITNDLLVAIYNQLAAQSNHTSITPVDPTSFFNQTISDKHKAVLPNTLLYISLTLCIVVSVIALAAKLWLVSYSHRAFSVGSPYDRAMKRQEAYNGVLAWNIGAVINTLPLILLVALIMFGFFIYTSIKAVQNDIGYAVAVLLTLVLIFLGSTSLGAAFVPGCPFHSTLSTALWFGFEIPQTFLKQILCKKLTPGKIRWLWMGSLAFLWVASAAVVAYNALESSGAFILVFVSVAITIAYPSQQKVAHKPQQYKISKLGAWMFLFIAPIMATASYFGAPNKYKYSIFLSLYTVGLLVLVFAGWMISQMSKSMVESGEIDAIAWLLRSTPSQDPEFFKKAGRIASLRSYGYHYRSRLLQSVMPLLSLLIISHHIPEAHDSNPHSPSSKAREDDDLPVQEASHTHNLEIYVSCLAQLSDFTDYEGSFWCLREDARRHPELGKPLIEQLMKLANARNRFQGLRSAATRVLYNYKLDIEGKPLTHPAVLRSVATATTLVLNSGGFDNQGQALYKAEDAAMHIEFVPSSEEKEVYSRHQSGESDMC